MSLEPGLKVIVAYKFGRAALVISGALIALSVVFAGLAPSLHQHAAAFHQRASGEISQALSDVLLATADPRHMLLIAGALALDGLLLIVEGWALLRHKLWGAWLVVTATSVLIPFELAALIHHPSVFRALIPLINAAIVAWLLQHALVQRRQQLTH